MSKIGEYIHLRRDTYLEVQGHSPHKNVTLFSQYRKARSKAVMGFRKTGLHSNTAKQLEKALNKLFPTTQTSLNDETDKLKQAILQEIDSYLNNRGPEMIKRFLNASMGEDLQTITDSKIEGNVLKRRAKIIEIRAILEDIQQRIKEEEEKSVRRRGWKKDIVAILEGGKSLTEIVINSKEGDSESNVDSIISKLVEVQSAIAKLLPKGMESQSGQLETSSKIIIRQAGRKKDTSLTISMDNKPEWTIQKDNVEEALDKIADFLKADSIVTKDIGDAAEYALGAIARACNLDTNGKAKKAMEEYVFGDARTSTYFNLDLFSSKLEFLEGAKSKSSTGKEKKLYTAIKEEIVGGDTVVKGYKSTSASQDKIDVVYESEDVEAILKSVMSEKAAKKVAKSMSLSVKNYTAGGTFGGVSGASFLSLVQSIDPDFVNHWINLTIGHQNGKNPSLFDFVSEEKENEVNDAHLIMQRYLIKLGAAGGALKFSKNKGAKFIDKAQYIVWNNRSGKTTNGVTWHVYCMSQILSGIEKMTDLNDYIKVNKENYKDYFQDQNKDKGWVTEATQIIQQRIDNVLKFMWEQKITTETPVNKALAALGKNLTS